MTLSKTLIAGFEIDATLSQEHSFESDVTQYPVESGGDITDHVRPKPVQLSIEGVVSDTPYGELKARRVAALGQLVGVVGKSNERILPSQEFRSFMLDIREKRQPVIVVTETRLYKSMILEQFSESIGPDTGDAIKFRCSFREIRIVTNERTVVKVSMPRAAKGKTNLGAKTALPVGPYDAKTYGPQLPTHIYDLAPTSKTQEDVSNLGRITNGQNVDLSRFTFGLL